MKTLKFSVFIVASLSVLWCLFSTVSAKQKLQSALSERWSTTLKFDASKGVGSQLSMPDGRVVKYTAYTHLYFVSEVEDSTYQYLNIFVPEGATEASPIFLRTGIGGYMASKASMPQASDASGRALAEGYVLVIPGSRGRGSTVLRGNQTFYNGRAPKALLDLKAAIRYLRHFDAQIPGNTEKIITDGTSAGGAMSSLMGATGNHPDYEMQLKKMGAADQRDDVFACVCFCPITDLDHADMAYEWLYGGTKSRKSLSETKRNLSAELAAQFSDYINALELTKPDGAPLTAENYLDYIKQLLMASAQWAKDAGAEIPDSIGFKFSGQSGSQPPINGGVGMPQGGMGGPEMALGTPPKGGMGPQGDGPMPADGMQQGRPQGRRPGSRGGRSQQGEYIVDLDMPTYLNYVVSTQALKGVPAFDSYGVDGASASGENGEFGNTAGSDVNFTDWAAEKSGTTLSDEVRYNVHLMNPMYYIDDPKATVAEHWYIRHGARDRDTAFPVAINLSTKLQNEGKDVDFRLAWNRPHSGDYALNEMFAWMDAIVK